MITVKERINLDEMAQFQGAGIVVEVRSNDHGKVGSKSDPAHAHILNSSGSQELAQIILSISPPENPSDIQWYRTKNSPDGLGSKIVKFAGMENMASRKVGIRHTNWESIVLQWIYFHGA